MRAVQRLGAAAVASLALVSAAQATLSVSIQVLPLPGAATDDAQLKIDPTHHPIPPIIEIDVTQGAGEKWSFGSLKTTLDAGAFYTPTTVNSHVGKEAIYSGVGFRHLQVDNFVTTPDTGTAVSILGKSDYPVTSPGTTKFPGSDAAFPTVVDTPDTLDITWGNQQAVNSTSGNSTYAIARVNVLGISLGTVVGHIGGTQHNFTDVPFSFKIPVPFDFNGDDSADSGDIPQALQVLGGDFDGYLALHPGFDVNTALLIGDLNADGGIDSGDIPEWLFVLGGGGAVPATVEGLGSLVPEPASLSMLALGALALARRQRR